MTLETGEYVYISDADRKKIKAYLDRRDVSVAAVARKVSCTRNQVRYLKTIKQTQKDILSQVLALARKAEPVSGNAGSGRPHANPPKGKVFLTAAFKKSMKKFFSREDVCISVVAREIEMAEANLRTLVAGRVRSIKPEVLEKLEKAIASGKSYEREWRQAATRAKVMGLFSEGHKQNEIAKLLRITPQRVSQIIKEEGNGSVRKQ
jgi:plasmid maintenance system antidote protein VapI